MFNVGDRVEFITGYGSIRKGMQGTVVMVRSGAHSIAMEMDEVSPHFHDCMGHTKNKHGYWVMPNVLYNIAKIINTPVEGDDWI